MAKKNPHHVSALGWVADASQSILSERDAARFLGVSAATLQSWRCTGRVRVPFVKLGRSVRYRLADLVEFLQAHTRSTTS